MGGIGGRGAALAVAAAVWIAAGGLVACEVKPDTRPNIVVITTDDQTLEQLRFMPITKELVGDAGITFTDARVSYSECCPSRSTFLTGQYSHNHKVVSSAKPTGGVLKLDASRTLAVSLRDAGYFTSLVGKYLNGYGADAPADVPPGWTDWHAMVDPSTYQAYGWTINDNGVLRTAGTDDADYTTDALATQAVASVQAAAGPAPFFLWFTPAAPHAMRLMAPTGNAFPIAAPRHRNTLAGTTFPKGPSFNEADVTDKPSQVAALPLLTETQIAGRDNWYRVEAEALRAVDEAVGRIIDALQDTGELDNTVVVFTSDNGFTHGEHRLGLAKLSPYQESIRVPLVVRGPGITPGTVSNAHVSNIDLAPTILQLTGATSTRVVDGESLSPLFLSPGTRPDRVTLLETGPYMGRVTYQGVVSRNWKYIAYSNGQRELYDLRADPHELVNRAGQPAFAEAQATLAARLAELKACAGDGCRRPAVGLPPAPTTT